MRKFLNDERGATAIEYGLIVCLIFLAIVTAVTAFGASATDKYNMIANRVNSAGGS